MIQRLFGSARRRGTTLGVGIAVAVFWLLGTWARPWMLFARGPSTSDFYDGQAHSLLAGHLSVPPGLLGLEGFTTDHGTQMYFGLGPTLLRMPVALFTYSFDHRLTLASQLLAVVVLGLSSARLLRRAEIVWRRAHPHSHTEDEVDRRVAWPYVWMGAAPVVLSPALFLSSRALVYHEAELWGAAAALWGLDLVLAWWGDRSPRRLVAAGFVAAFAMSCRPSSGSAPLMAMGLLGIVLAWRREWVTALAAAGTAVLAAASYMAVNLARFGLLVSAPFAQQVFSTYDTNRKQVLADNDGGYFSLKYLPTIANRYLSPWPGVVRPARMFPFVEFGSRAHVIGNVRFDFVNPSGSFPTMAPALTVLAAIGVGVVIRRPGWRAWWVLAASAALSTASTFTIAYIAHRYLTDLLPLCVVLAAPGTWWLIDRWPTLGARVRRTLAGAALAISVLSLLAQVGVTVTAHAVQLLPDPAERRAFVSLQYDLDARLHDGQPPAVTIVEKVPARSTVKEGDVVILGECAALYRYDGSFWGALERRSGGGRRAMISPSADIVRQWGKSPVVIAHGTGWQLEADPLGDGRSASIVYSSGKSKRFGAPLRVTELDDQLDVIADFDTFDVQVRHQGRLVVDQWLVRSGGLQVAPGWTLHPDDPTLCERLRARLG